MSPGSHLQGNVPAVEQWDTFIAHNYLEEMKKKGYLFLMRYKNITLHNILLDVLKLSLLCLIGYSMALQSVKIWEECLLSLFKLFHNKALQSVKIWEECLLFYSSFSTSVL